MLALQPLKLERYMYYKALVCFSLRSFRSKGYYLFPAPQKLNVCSLIYLKVKSKQLNERHIFKPAVYHFENKT